MAIETEAPHAARVTDQAHRAASARAILVRHAQASFGADDYDQLSARGERQAELLGAWIAAHPELRLQRLVRGTQRRHAQTLDAIARACAQAGRELPEVDVHADWNEFDHVALFHAWAASHRDDARLSLLASEPGSARVRGLIGDVFSAWRDGSLDGAMPERWKDFAARAQRALESLAHTPGTNMVVSSGGVIARCAQAALGLDDGRTIAMNLSIANSAISDFRRHAHGWDLLSWNGLPHLAAAEHIALTSHY